MLPVLWRRDWGGVTLRLGSYPFLIFCGALAALLIVLHRARSAQCSPRALLPIFTASIVVGFLGARLASVIQTGAGGLVLYGGLIAGLLTGLLTARWQGLPVLRVADLAVPGVLLATAFGRIACLLAGCCYGVVSGSGLCYPRGSHAFHDQLRHGLLGSHATESLPTVPIVLLESLALVAIFVIASVLWRRRLSPGTVFGASGVLYGAWRFLAEFWRADNLPYWPGGLTFSQGISLVLVGACGLFVLLRQPGSVPGVPPLEFRPASALQVLLFLAAPCLSLMAISCGSHQNSEPHTTSGVHQYRNPDAGGKKSPDPKQGDKKSEDDWFGDCIGECTGDCIEACTDAMCEQACSGGSGSDGANSGDPAQPPLYSALGMIRPGQKYQGSIGIEAIVNQRLSVLLKVDGRLSAWRTLPDGTRPVRLRLKKVSLVVGDARWQGSGEVDVEVGPKGDVKMTRSTLPADLMSALAALQKLTGNLLWGATSEQPLEDLGKVVQEELSVPNPKAEMSMVTTIDGREKWMLGEANVVKEPDGSYRLFWRITY